MRGAPGHVDGGSDRGSAHRDAIDRAAGVPAGGTGDAPSRRARHRRRASEVIASLRVDAARLPLVRWGPPEASSRVRVTASGPARYGFLVDRVSFAEFTIDDDFGAFTGEDFFHGSFPACGTRARRGRAAWRGFSQRNWTDSGVDVEMSRGSFDFLSCAAAADTTIRGRAAALVPGFIYALRLEDMASQYLWVLLPRASLASASEDAAASGSFSMATLLLEPHQSAAAALRISPAALATWRRMRRARDVKGQSDQVSDGLLVSIDVDPSPNDDLAISIAFALPRGGHERDFAAILDAVR